MGSNLLAASNRIAIMNQNELGKILHSNVWNIHEYYEYYACSPDPSVYKSFKVFRSPVLRMRNSEQQDHAMGHDMFLKGCQRSIVDSFQLTSRDRYKLSLN